MDKELFAILSKPHIGAYLAELTDECPELLWEWKETVQELREARNMRLRGRLWKVIGEQGKKIHAVLKRIGAVPACVEMWPVNTFPGDFPVTPRKHRAQ